MKVFVDCKVVCEGCGYSYSEVLTADEIESLRGKTCHRCENKRLEGKCRTCKGLGSIPFSLPVPTAIPTTAVGFSYSQYHAPTHLFQQMPQSRLQRKNCSDCKGTGNSTTKERFREYADKWMAEIAAVSSLHNIIDNKNLRAIMKMNKDEIIPLIIEEMRKTPFHWEMVLALLTNYSPGPLQKGDGIVDVWERWYRSQKEQPYPAWSF